ncbi:hypothetical protein, partial [Ralstonia sp.]|uniref:hypothetical protein n=1 Tax=Ralstonia sp. TaxID=54061 RepID=UPI0039784213
LLANIAADAIACHNRKNHAPARREATADRPGNEIDKAQPSAQRKESTKRKSKNKNGRPHFVDQSWAAAAALPV